jgi:regulator of chromosome condensation
LQQDDKGKFAFSADDIKTRKGQPRPKLVPHLHNITSLAAGSNHVLAINKSGTIFAWGCNQQDQLGTRLYPKHFSTSHEPGLESLIPSPVFLPGKKIVSIACGSYHSFATDHNGRVYAWGLNNYGQTGISFGAGGDKATIELPTLVQSLASRQIKQIRGGNHHSIACETNGAVLTWGRCDDGQTGLDLDSLPHETFVKDERGNPRILLTPTQIPSKAPPSL